MSLTYGSLCSGYGGLDLAVEAVFGATPAWHAEVDPNASRVLEAHWPGVLNLGDLTAVDWTTVPSVDVLCGGYPCQPFSHAGRRKGTDDDRHIWPYIAGAIRVLRPRCAVFENVAGHVGLGFDSVLGDLAEIGFDAEWALVRASDVGAPHRRERLFVVAADTRSMGRRQRTGLRPDKSGQVGRRRLGDHDGAPAADAQGHEQREPAIAGPLRPEPRDGHHGSPADTNGTGPQGRQAHAERGNQRTTGPRSVGFGAYAPAIARWEHIIGRDAPHPAPDGRLSPHFVEWMMGLPAGWVTDHIQTRTAALRALGNGVVPQQATAAIAGLVERFAPDPGTTTKEQAA